MWFLLVAIYTAPPDAVDWQGTWELGITRLMERGFESEADCRIGGDELKANLNEGMLAPVRFHCIKVLSELPAGIAK